MDGSRTEERAGLGLFQGFGIELEYMIVDAERLSVLPVADELIRSVTGDYASDVENGAIAWSNELVLHVIELKTNGPVPALPGVAARFQENIARIHTLLEPLGGRLMPTGMHPWMDPEREMRLWPHGDRAIYQTFDRIFDCRGHGWSNLQSMHINLPFDGDDQFARLHAAVRVLLPLLPALAASSPVLEGRLTGVLDNRLDVYRSNARRVPSVSGAVVPEPVFSRAAYEREILGRIYHDLAPYDTAGTLRHEWVNARGAIARFDRSAIEIRVLDTQECPAADLALAAVITAVARALTEEAWCGLHHLQDWETGALHELFLRTLRHGDDAVIADRRYTDAFGFPERGRCRARDLWQHLMETLILTQKDAAAEWREVLALYLRRGTLARRIVDALGPKPDREHLGEVYLRLCDCLRTGRSFDG